MVRRLLCSSLDPVEAVFAVASPLNQQFVEELRKALPVPLHLIPAHPDQPSDLWMQDSVEFGVSVEPGGKESFFALTGLRGEHDMGLEAGLLDGSVKEFLSVTLPHVEQISVGQPLPGRRWIDWFGNLECSPPCPGFPYGRALVGRQGELSIHSAVLDFLEEQNLQWPPIELDVSWLVVGHVDEILNFVPGPDGFLCLVPDIQAGRALISEAPEGYVFWEDKPWSATAAQILEKTDPSEEEAIGRSLDQTIETLGRELSLSEDRFIRIPLLFAQGQALWPNSVNSLVVGSNILAPDPEDDLIRTATLKAFEKAAVTVKFLSSWDPYHVRGGEVHCGTNALRRRA